MKVLALDTSTRAGSLALTEQGRLVASFLLDLPAAHSARLLPSLDRLLRDAEWRLADLDLLVCVQGPGNFTGLRNGLSTAKGLAFAAELPLIGVNSLEATALGFSYANTPICPMLDARKKQVFAALFLPDGRGGLERLRDDESVFAGDYAAGVRGPCLFVGDGAELYASAIVQKKSDALVVPSAICYPRAAGAALLGETAYLAGRRGLVAHYVRASDAELNPKFAGGGS